jgi:hypothetical protein
MNSVLFNYILDFLARFNVSSAGIVAYSSDIDSDRRAKIIIVPAVENFNIQVMPELPFQLLDDVPVLYGKPHIKRIDGRLIIYADIIASSFFLLSRYEEILKPECRDIHKRFTAKYSVVFKEGYGLRPIVDEYSNLLRKWLVEAGMDIPPIMKGFAKVYLTHDVDSPFLYKNIYITLKQCIKNIIHYHYNEHPIRKFLNGTMDDYYTFSKIIEYDNGLIKKLQKFPVKSIYFLITAGTFLKQKYYNFFSKKNARLIKYLNDSNAELGLHISYEGGLTPQKIKKEAKILKKALGASSLISRNHYLLWREPEDVAEMEKAGITDDFTLGYADHIGFRVGTCRPYRFINPWTKELTNVTIHPLEIMDGTLHGDTYMNLNYEEALAVCKKLIDQVYKHNGELVLLWHNTEFIGKNYQEKLYKNILEYIANIAS